MIEHLRGQSAYRQQQAKRFSELSRSDASRADALEDSLILVFTRLQPTSTRFSFPTHELTSRKSQVVEIDDEDALLTWTPKTDPVLMRASLSARLGQEKPHETQTPQPRADHPQAANC